MAFLFWQSEQSICSGRAAGFACLPVTHVHLTCYFNPQHDSPQVVTQEGRIGTIDGSFGKSGKFKVSFQSPITPPQPGCSSITLTFKRYVYDQNKKALHQ